MLSRSSKKQVYSGIYKILQRSGMTGLLAHYHLRTKGYLVEYGWFEAFARGMPVNDIGEPLPWLAYPVIDLLQERLKPHFRVFEYGSGASSRWWAARVQQVTSVEHDERWYQMGVDKAPKNLRILHRQGEQYSSAIREEGVKYHVVVVDGRWRSDCAIAGADSTTDDGIIIWDNSERERYQAAQAELRGRGFKQLRLRGIAPSSVELQETSILYRLDNCLEL